MNIKSKGNGQHKDCKVCSIEDIKEKKKTKLKENITELENLSKTLEKSINDLKIIFEQINTNKEEIKLKIQKMFTSFRNKLNEKEDEMLSEIDKQVENSFNESIIKESEKLPNKIKISLEKGKIIDEEWKDDNKLSFYINNCINIENNINDIIKIKEKIKECNLNNFKIKFNSKENEINKLFEEIKTFDNIYYTKKFKFKECPINIKDEEKKYKLSGENENIATKIGYNAFSEMMMMKNGLNSVGIICQNEIQNNIECRWKIKILKSKYYDIMVGVAPIDYDINKSSSNYGWYFHCGYCKLFSGPPHKYNNKKTNINKPTNEITIILNLINKTLKFIVDNEDKGESYSNIPTDKSLTPAVLLSDKNDSVEILEC